MNKKKTLILIDGHALAFRQYYALERTNMSTSSGTPSWAVYGFFKAIFDLLKNDTIAVDAIAVTFDVSHHTFRIDAYEQYKSNRQAMPDSLRVQIEIIKEGLKAFSIPIYTKEGVEADDVIGTLSKRACDLGHNVLILTGDQDAFQLVEKDGCVKVIIPARGELTVYDWEKVYEKMGVYPNQVIDYKALRGDNSDNIPGIYGIGEKIAGELLAQFGTLDNLLNNTEQIAKSNIRKRVEEGVEQARLSKYLATIVRDVDIEFDFENACVEIPDVVKVTEFLREMQFHSMLRNLTNIMASFNKGVPCTKEDIINKSPDAGQLQLSLLGSSTVLDTNLTCAEVVDNYELEVIQTEDKLREVVSNIKKQSVITLHAEAVVQDILNCRVAGIGIGVSNELTYRKSLKVVGDAKSTTKVYYIPVGHKALDKQLLIENVMSILKPVLEDENIKKVTYNMKAQYGIFRDYGVIVNGIVLDTMLASYVATPNRSQDLSVQSIENLHHALVDYKQQDGLPKDKMLFEDVSEDTMKCYAGDVVDTITRLAKYWLGQMNSTQEKLLYDIDQPLTLVLADMEFTGITMDVDLLAKYSLEIRSLIFDIEQKVFTLADETFNLNSPKQVSAIIYDKLQLIKRRKRSTGAEILEELAKEHEICHYILEYRKFHKLKTTYLDGFQQLADPKDNRIHTTFHLTTTTTGRLSSSNPNLQNLPVRTEYGNKIRAALVPADRENYLILSADYSQIELRLLAHISGDNNLIAAFQRGKDVHTMIASKIFDVSVKDVTKEMRYKAKAVNFGIIYGQSKYGLAKALNIPVVEADNFIVKFFKTYPRVRRYMNNTISQVEKKGYAETMFGRRRYFSTEIDSAVASVREFARRAAINFPIQGAGADLIKKAMLDCYNRMRELGLRSKMILQVHDEIVIEVHKDELELVKTIIKEAMEQGQPFDVPLVVDIKVGSSWLEE